MASRCKICGTPVSYVDVCNHCRNVREERRFLRMVNREELKETLTLSKDPETVRSSKNIVTR